MFNAWKTSAVELFTLAAGSPESKLEMAVVAVAGLLAFAAVIRVVTGAVRMPMSDIGRCMQVTLFGTLCVLAVAVLVQVHVAPRIGNATLQRFAPLIAAVIAVPAIVVPITCATHRGNYVQSLLAVVLALAAAAGMVLLVHTGFNTAASGEERGKHLRKRKDELERFMHRAPAGERTLYADHGAMC